MNVFVITQMSKLRLGTGSGTGLMWAGIPNPSPLLICLYLCGLSLSLSLTVDGFVVLLEYSGGFFHGGQDRSTQHYWLSR